MRWSGLIFAPILTPKLSRIKTQIFIVGMHCWKVLVIDQSDQPIELIHWTDAVLMLLQDKAEVVYEYENVQIRSEKLRFLLPSVLRLRKFFKRRGTPKFSRYSIFFRDKWKCQYCGDKKQSKDLTFDHVVPRSIGGKTTWENIVTACMQCNRYKANRTPEEAGMTLLSKPKKPQWSPCITIRIKESDPQVWKDYLYWHTELEASI